MPGSFGKSGRNRVILRCSTTFSRNVITTLNPDEMLAKIAEELEQGLDYSHIGIGCSIIRARKL